MDADQIRSWDLRARAGFSYLADPVGDDNWRSHADDALAGRAWAGDCDDQGSTVLDLLGRAGLPLDHRYRLVVGANGSMAINHFVGAALDDAGALWIVGDTFAAEPYPAAARPHVPIQYQRLDERTTAGDPLWRMGAPWAAL